MTTEVNGGTVRHRIGRDGSFSLRTMSGTVRLRGTDGDEVVLNARTSASDEAPALTVRRYEGGLHVEPEGRGVSFLGATIGIGQPEIEFEVDLPASARIELNSVSAEVSGSLLHGDQSYKLVSGPLLLHDVGGRLDVKSVSGDVCIRGSRPLEIDVVTTSGDLEVDGRQLELVRLRSVSGNATIQGALAAGPEHRVETVSGDLRLEPEAGLTVEASGPIVGLRSSIGGRASSRRGQRSFIVGDGAAQLRFRSMSGQVSLEERGAPSRSRPAATPETRSQPAGESRDPLEILRAVERGELDVEEASRLLEEHEHA